MILSQNAAIFIHAFNHRLGSTRRDLQELRAEKVRTAFPSNGWDGPYDAIIETSCPHVVTIRDRAAIRIRVTIIAHNREHQGVTIEEDVTLGAGAIILPNVTIGRGAIVTAGSVITKSVPPKTMVQGNPARPIATVEVPLGLNVRMKEFAKVCDQFGRGAGGRNKQT